MYTSFVYGQRPEEGKVIHHDRLKLCQDRDIPMWLRRLRHQYFYTEMQNLSETASQEPDLDDVATPGQSLNVSQDYKDKDPGEDEYATTKVDVGNSLQRDGHQTRRGRPLVPPARFRDFTLE